jgi:thiol-disulfide isomerase/thioredoxin
MDHCGPCELTKPEWKKFKEENNENIIIDIEQKNDHEINAILKPLNFSLPGTYPCILYIHNGKVEEYQNPKRTLESFNEWLKDKTQNQKGGRKRKTLKRNKKSNKYRKTRGKWSLKYKKKINCNYPKGFSQRQHCKYGRKN